MIDMGMGKTLITLTALQEMIDFEEIGRVLVVAPLRVARSVWKQEAEKWDHLNLDISLVLGPREKRLEALRRAADIYVINVDNLKWLVDLVGKDWPFDAVVLDEFSLFKSPSAKTRFKALKRVTPYPETVIGLTGTPAANGLLDLWSQMYLLDQGARLGKAMTHFKARYFDHDYMKFNWWPRPGAEDEIHAKLSDICLSMSADDYLELPDALHNTLPVDLPGTAMRQYLELEREMFLELAHGDVLAMNAAALSNKCLQFANGAVYTGDSKHWEEVHQAKLEALDSVLEEAAGQPVLCFYTYLSDLARLEARYSNAVRLDKSQETIDRWNRGEIPLLLAHPASAGHGLNLQAGGHIIAWFGLTWSLENYLQANARLDRQGQKHPVMIHHIVARGTVDELVMQRLESKRSVQDILLEALKRKEAA